MGFKKNVHLQSKNSINSHLIPFLCFSVMFWVYGWWKAFFQLFRNHFDETKMCSTNFRRLKWNPRSLWLSLVNLYLNLFATHYCVGVSQVKSGHEKCTFPSLKMQRKFIQPEPQVNGSKIQNTFAYFFSHLLC